MSFPVVEIEMTCTRCGEDFTSEGRYEQCSDDPYDLDFTPTPRCPECNSEECEHTEDVIRCMVCNKPIESAELCAGCAEGNDPFITSKYNESRRY